LQIKIDGFGSLSLDAFVDKSGEKARIGDEIWIFEPSQVVAEFCAPPDFRAPRHACPEFVEIPSVEEAVALTTFTSSI
jgi:hypothetical protein